MTDKKLYEVHAFPAPGIEIKPVLFINVVAKAVSELDAAQTVVNADINRFDDDLIFWVRPLGSKEQHTRFTMADLE